RRGIPRGERWLLRRDGSAAVRWPRFRVAGWSDDPACRGDQSHDGEHVLARSEPARAAGARSEHGAQAERHARLADDYRRRWRSSDLWTSVEAASRDVHALHAGAVLDAFDDGADPRQWTRCATAAG